MYYSDATSNGAPIILYAIWLWLVYKAYKSGGTSTAMKMILGIIGGVLLFVFGVSAVLVLLFNIHYIVVGGILLYILYSLIFRRE